MSTIANDSFLSFYCICAFKNIKKSDKKAREREREREKKEVKRWPPQSRHWLAALY